MDYSKLNFYDLKTHKDDNFLKDQMNGIFDYIKSLDEEEGLKEIDNLFSILLATKPTQLTLYANEPMNLILVYHINSLTKNFQEKFLEFYKQYADINFEKMLASYLLWKLDKIEREKLLQEIINIGGETLKYVCMNAFIGFQQNPEGYKKSYANSNGKIPEFFVYKLYEEGKGLGFDLLLNSGLIEPTKTLANYIQNFNWTVENNLGEAETITDWNKWVLYKNLNLFKEEDKISVLNEYFRTFKNEYEKNKFQDYFQYIIPHLSRDLYKSLSINSETQNMYIYNSKLKEILKYPSLYSKIC